MFGFGRPVEEEQFRPYVFALDWTFKLHYQNLLGKIDIDVARSLPERIECLDALVIHGSGSLHHGCINRAVKKAYELGAPVFVEGMSDFAYDMLIGEYSDLSDLDISPVYVSTLREILFEKLGIVGD